jgi:Ca2+-binding RTX toxin-like protein
MQQSETIDGGSGAGAIDITFTADGSIYALATINALVGAIQTELTGGQNTDPVAPTGSTQLFRGTRSPAATPIYQLTPGSVQGGPPTYDIANAGYVIDTIAAAAVINVDTAGGDSIIVVGTDPATTVNSLGKDNLIVFIDGDNVYSGGASSRDTVIGGTGNDTVNTGTGPTLVRAGIGSDSITLNDTVAGAYSDTVYLDTGRNLVVANGRGDYVVATTEGQTITGGAGETSGSNLTVVLLPNSDGTQNGDDLVTGGAGYLTVGDEGSGNTIRGGSGGLTFIAAPNITATVEAGSGQAVLFGSAGVDLTLDTQTEYGAGTTFDAGTGNETLNGASASGNLLLFGASQADTGSVADVLAGGSGNDTLIAGAGQETLTGGPGTNIFLIDAVGSANSTLTISDLHGADSVDFSKYTQAEVTGAISSGYNDNGNFVVRFSESNSTVTFDGITNASQLIGHVVVF